MKKKLLVSIFIVVLCFALTGCGNSVSDIIDDVTGDITNDIIDTGDDNNATNGINLYSDNNKIVYNYYDAYFMVFYHDGTNITGEELYYNYQDVTTASYALASIKADMDDEEGIESVKQSGTYVIVKYDSSMYEGFTVETVRAAYAALDEVQE